MYFDGVEVLWIEDEKECHEVFFPTAFTLIWSGLAYLSMTLPHGDLQQEKLKLLVKLPILLVT